MKIIGTVATQPGSVTDSGRDSTPGDSKFAVTAGKEAIEFDRS